jgi:hypothetical protein
MSARQVRTAAKYYVCAERHHNRMIAPGDKYVRITIFPTDGLIAKPVQTALCFSCGEGHHVG